MIKYHNSFQWRRHREGGRPPPLTDVLLRMPCALSGEYIGLCIIFKIIQTYYIGNLLLGDELAIAQQQISDILTCSAADVLDRAPLAVKARIGAPLASPIYGVWGRQEVPYRGAP